MPRYTQLLLCALLFLSPYSAVARLSSTSSYSVRFRFIRDGVPPDSDDGYDEFNVGRDNFGSRSNNASANESGNKINSNSSSGPTHPTRPEKIVGILIVVLALGLIVGLIIRWCMIRWRGKPAILQGDNTELANEAEMGQKTWGVIDPPHTDPNIATGAAPKSTSLMTHTDRALPAVPRDVHEGEDDSDSDLDATPRASNVAATASPSPIPSSHYHKPKESYVVPVSGSGVEPHILTEEEQRADESEESYALSPTTTHPRRSRSLTLSSPLTTTALASPSSPSFPSSPTSTDSASTITPTTPISASEGTPTMVPLTLSFASDHAHDRAPSSPTASPSRWLSRNPAKPRPKSGGMSVLEEVEYEKRLKVNARRDAHSGNGSGDGSRPDPPPEYSVNEP